jgi:Tol biopolymer transport system component
LLAYPFSPKMEASLPNPAGKLQLVRVVFSIHGWLLMHKRSLMVLLILLALLLPGSFSRAVAQQVPAFEGQIAYIGAEGNVWVLRGDGSPPIPVTYDAGPQRRYYSPRWSRDGSRLAYCAADPAGTGSGQLFTSWTGEWLPFLVSQDVYCKESSTALFDWSLDGSKILYARAFTYFAQGGKVWEPYYGIWEADTVSGAQREVIPPPGENPLILPDLSPDGRWVRFYELIYIEGLGVMRTWQVETSSMAGWLTLGGELFPGLSSWSPDSSQLVFDQVTYVGFPGSGLYAANPDGIGVREVYVENDEAASHPLWSPDGQNIMFVLSSFGEGAAGGPRLALVDPQGQNPRQIFRGPGSITPIAWSPSGSQLLFGYAEGEQIDLMLYDIPSDTRTAIATLGDWTADWSCYPKARLQLPRASDSLLDVPYSPSLLLAVSPDYMAVLRDPATDLEAPLTRPMTVAGFTPSASRRNLVFGNRWLSLDFRENGKLAVHTTLLPAAPKENLVNWSPDETHLAFQTQEGAVWLVDLSGNAVQVPDATGLPEWSYNGQWLSYCTAGDALWLVGSASPPSKIVDASICQHRWSSGQDLLAYTAISAEQGAATLRSYLFDPATGESTPVKDGVSVDSWSPDGRYLALKRTDPRGYTIFAYDPASSRQLFLGQFDGSNLGLQSWLQAGSGYFYGPYRIAADLSAANRVADSLFGASADGNTLLIGIGERDLLTIACVKANSGAEVDLLTFNLSTVPADEKPGIWAQLSPDGGWVQVRAYDPSGETLRLDSCDGSSQEELPSVKFSGDFFSNDSRWHSTSEVSTEGSGQVIVRDLSGEADKSLPAILASPVYWLKEPSAGSPETNLVSGYVFTAEGTPLAGVVILLEGNPKTTSGEDGSFVISGLAPGKYTLEPQLSDAKFEPENRKVSLPPDVLDANFTSNLSAAAAGQTTAESSPVQSTPPAQPAGSVGLDYAGIVEGALGQYGIQYESWMAFAAAIICLAILGLLLAGVLAWYLLRSGEPGQRRCYAAVAVSRSRSSCACFGCQSLPRKIGSRSRGANSRLRHTAGASQARSDCSYSVGTPGSTRRSGAAALARRDCPGEGHGDRAGPSEITPGGAAPAG